MTTDQRRPLHRSFSEPSVDVPVQADGRARLLAVERAPFQEPPVPAEAPSLVPLSGRRRLSPDGLSFSVDSTGAVSGSES